jgi:hypothetical protein
MTFAICLDNEGYEGSLELRKIYQVLPPESNDPKGYIRIVDESREDYAVFTRQSTYKLVLW